MAITPKDVNGVLVFAPSGVIERALAGDLGKAFLRYERGTKIVVDFGAVTSIKSLGISVFILANQLRLDVRIAAASEGIENVFKIAMVKDYFQFFETVEAAVASFGS